MTSCPTWVDNVLFVSRKSRMGVATIVLVSFVSPYLYITAWQFACGSTKTTHVQVDFLMTKWHALFQLSVDKGSGHIWLRTWIIQVPLTFKPEIVTKGAFLLMQRVMNSDFWGIADHSIVPTSKIRGGGCPPSYCFSFPAFLRDNVIWLKMLSELYQVDVHLPNPLSYIGCIVILPLS